MSQEKPEWKEITCGLCSVKVKSNGKLVVNLDDSPHYLMNYKNQSYHIVQDSETKTWKAFNYKTKEWTYADEEMEKAIKEQLERFNKKGSKSTTRRYKMSIDDAIESSRKAIEAAILQSAIIYKVNDKSENRFDIIMHIYDMIMSKI